MDRQAGREDAALFLGPRRPPAGLWECWRNPETKEPIESATIIVGPAHEWMQPFHDRMPVILDWCDVGAWMHGDYPSALLHPPPEDALREWVVSTRVNRAGAGDDDPALIEAVEPA